MFLCLQGHRESARDIELHVTILPLLCWGNFAYLDCIHDVFAFSSWKLIFVSTAFVHNKNLYAVRIGILLMEN